ncbi:UBA domain-containing protein 7 [Zancudomyces culisetae]|uniref:UBA domain-containing protein 7 n=1 Tax=Zancudomyces culisetae TaxID=1213189 RepID=A0A1R1PW36_ZANCU|nr:UBA domain-containing protein 7 [Zancudomyces culisetae]|eukprot:OMH85196.1 UBA domain-containing protein 7 [Zancudomyces culisetae]
MNRKIDLLSGESKQENGANVLAQIPTARNSFGISHREPLNTKNNQTSLKAGSANVGNISLFEELDLFDLGRDRSHKTAHSSVSEGLGTDENRKNPPKKTFRNKEKEHSDLFSEFVTFPAVVKNSEKKESPKEKKDVWNFDLFQSTINNTNPGTSNYNRDVGIKNQSGNFEFVAPNLNKPAGDKTVNRMGFDGSPGGPGIQEGKSLFDADIFQNGGMGTGMNFRNTGNSMDEDTSELLGVVEVEARIEEEKRKANALYRLGQYEEASKVYSELLAIIDRNPEVKSLKAIMYNNRAQSYLKMGDFEHSLRDSEKVINLHIESSGNGGIGENQLMKAYLRRAEICEGKENYEFALDDYKKVLEMKIDQGTFSKARAGIERCKPKGKGKKKNLHLEAKKPFNTTNVGRMPSKPKNGTENKVSVLQKHEDEVLVIVDRWRLDKENNLLALLTSIHVVYKWIEPINLSDLLDSKSVKKVYTRTLAQIHPDKLSMDVDTRRIVLAKNVFSVLTHAWAVYKAEHNM